MTETLERPITDHKTQSSPPSEGSVRVRRAIMSVYDKSGLQEFAQTLSGLGISIISTGGTLSALQKFGIAATAVEDVTGFPEMLGGRVKTLHPKMLGGILARRHHPGDDTEIKNAEIEPIDLVVINLYPFAKAADDPTATFADAIELIDVGGPTMIRAAAKNHDAVTVVCDPSDYEIVAAELKDTGGLISRATRSRLATKAFAVTAAYDARITAYLQQHGDVDVKTEFPSIWVRRYDRVSGLRYGENPHQDAAVYADGNPNVPSLARARVIGGKELSYNNYNDLDAAWRMAADFDEPFAAVFKHATPCGAAQANTIHEAYVAAHATDPLSAYGSIVSLNRRVDMACADVLHQTTFIECVIAPGYDEDALALLTKKKARRFVEIETMDLRSKTRIREIVGGILIQDEDTKDLNAADLRVVTRAHPTDEQIQSMLFARKVVKHARSNAIALVQGTAAVGIGAGQTSRVDAVRQAAEKAGDRAMGSILASDAFFPMADGVEVAAKAGVKAIIQPGGSKRDDEVIAACNDHGVTMVFSGMRNFRH